MIPVIVCTLIVGASSTSPAHLGKVGVKNYSVLYGYFALCDSNRTFCWIYF
ncbi:hypothetical protein [Campylobacter sp. RM16191]